MATTTSSSFDELGIDRAEIAQSLLDLQQRDRTNIFPWRGQFSPGLVDILLSAYGKPGALVLDPFAGVGTTMFEAARKGMSGIGTEVNPAAVAMAETISFLRLNLTQRRRVLENVLSLLRTEFPDEVGPLFAECADQEDVSERLAQLAVNVPKGDPERSVLINLLIRACDAKEASSDAVRRALHQYSDVVEALPYSVERYSIINTDARKLPLDDGSVDLIMTSPPYINVFNYHQNNRRAMEALGWDLLHVAKSEFGSNRKHRGNRFITVIQYCLDMEAALLEMRRVVKRDGRAILIVGRESCVRGVAFYNGSIVGAIAPRCRFKVVLRQERKYKNKFGALIYEDLSHLAPSDQDEQGLGAREIGLTALKAGLCNGLKDDIAEDLRAAIAQANGVKQSPIYVPRDPGLRQ